MHKLVAICQAVGHKKPALKQAKFFSLANYCYWLAGWLASWLAKPDSRPLAQIMGQQSHREPNELAKAANYITIHARWDSHRLSWV